VNRFPDVFSVTDVRPESTKGTRFRCKPWIDVTNVSYLYPCGSCIIGQLMKSAVFATVHINSYFQSFLNTTECLVLSLTIYFCL